MAEAPKTDRSASSAGQSCRECRRRKGKCDGTMPVCSVCQRYNRHCLYDKHSRSSLTRKHLTEVEERLEKAEALLRSVFTDTELSQMLAHGVSNRVNVASTSSVNRPTVSDNASFQSRRVTSPMEGTPTRQHPNEAFFSTSPEVDQKLDFGVLEPPISSTSNADNVPLPFESLPSADDDFEWDEREPSWTLADPGSGASALESGAEGDIPKITDGMATLTADDSNTGFMGSVSGAALLRLIWMGTTTEGSDDKPESRKNRRKSLEQLFENREEIHPSPSSWLRTQPLITRAMVDNLVDAYFQLYHPTFPILHEHSFREQYSTISSRPGGSTFHILANLVAVLGSFVSSTCSDGTHATLFNAVKTNLSIGSLETGSLGLVQAFAMAATYLQKRNRPNSGYNYGGIALRLAISLGLHKEFHGWQTTPFKKEIRRRVWWSLCVLDVGATVTYGRPLSWPQVGVETAFPLNIHDKDLVPTSTSFPPELNEPTLYTYIRTQSLYHLRTMRIYNRLISNPLPSAAELISLDDELVQGWLNGLPSFFNDDDLPLSNEYLLGHSISRWRFRLLRIIMYRPYLIRWAQNGFGAAGTTPPVPAEADLTAETTATRRCFQAAEECISWIFRFWSTGTHTRLAAWYVLYFLLQAALIPIHCLRRNPTHADAASWRAQVLTAQNIIDAMTDLNPSALKCRDIIHRLCGESLYPPHLRPPRHSYPHSHLDPHAPPQMQTQTQTQQEPPLQWSPSPYTDDPAFTNSAAFPDATDPDLNFNLDPWMTEVDTAIDGYDIYCDRLSNAAMVGMGIGMGMGTEMGDLGTASGTGTGPGSDAALFSTDGTEIGTGVQDWDWGLML